MNEPVNVVAEMREHAKILDWRVDMRENVGALTITRWADRMERLEAEVGELEAQVASHDQPTVLPAVTTLTAPLCDVCCNPMELQHTKVTVFGQRTNRYMLSWFCATIKQCQRGRNPKLPDWNIHGDLISEGDTL